MPDRLFSVLFLMQCILVAAWFLIHPALFLPFYFYSVFIRCCEYTGFFSFCLLGWLYVLVMYSLSYCVVYDQMMVPQSQQFNNRNLSTV